MQRILPLLCVFLSLMATGTAQVRGNALSPGSDVALSNSLTSVELVPDLTCPTPLAEGDCIYYGGDFDPTPKKKPNGLFNETIVSGSTTVTGRVWVPLAVKKQIQIQGLFLNELFSGPTPPKTLPADWEVRSGISPGNGGTVICGGTETATRVGLTGRQFTVGNTLYKEYTYRIPISEANFCTLTNPAAGGMLPDNGQCPPYCHVGGGTGSSGGALGPMATNIFYLSDTNGLHHIGMKNAPHEAYYSVTCTPANACTPKNFVRAEDECKNNPPEDALTVGGCKLFSLGLIGTGK